MPQADRFWWDGVPLSANRETKDECKQEAVPERIGRDAGVGSRFPLATIITLNRMIDNDDASRRIKTALFHGSDPQTPATQILLEQYRIYLQLVDKVGDRRQSANSFFLSINTGLCALMGYMFAREVPAQLRPLLWVIPFPGIIISYFWFRLVRSYRYLNAAKFRVVELIEEQMPIAPYAAEWVALQEDADAHRYVPLTKLEVWIPRSFICLYFAILALLIPWRDLFAAMSRH